MRRPMHRRIFAQTVPAYRRGAERAPLHSFPAMRRFDFALQRIREGGAAVIVDGAMLRLRQLRRRREN